MSLAAAGSSFTPPFASGWCGSELAEVVASVFHLTCKVGLKFLMHGEGRDDNAARRNEAATREEAAISKQLRKEREEWGNNCDVADINSSTMT